MTNRNSSPRRTTERTGFFIFVPNLRLSSLSPCPSVIAHASKVPSLVRIHSIRLRPESGSNGPTLGFGKSRADFCQRGFDNPPVARKRLFGTNSGARSGGAADANFAVPNFELAARSAFECKFFPLRFVEAAARKIVRPNFDLRRGHGRRRRFLRCRAGDEK